MSAGCIAVPIIVPLHVDGGPRNCFSSDTKIELHSDSPNSFIFYTFDGSSPEPFSKRTVANGTLKYCAPFCLPPGKITLKAIAASKDLSKLSNTVTKSFQVTQSSSYVAAQKTDKPRRQFASVNGARRGGGGGVRGEPLPQHVVDGAFAAELICPSCCAPRLGRQARFCSECGVKYPELPTPPLDLVQESRLECRLCKHANAPTADACAQCESPLEDARQKLVAAAKLEPPLRLAVDGSASASAKCAYCTASNPADARFCGSCGKQARANALANICARCQQKMPRDAVFCLHCGSLLSSPKLNDSSGGLFPAVSVKALSRTLNGDSSVRTSQSAPSPVHRLMKPTALMKGTSVKPLSSVSPGCGYWRQQLDHIFGHLKVYSQTNGAFQRDVADVQVGRIVDAFVEVSINSAGAEVFRLVADFEVATVEPAKGAEVGSRYRQAAERFAVKRQRDTAVQRRSRPNSRSSAVSRSSRPNSRQIPTRRHKSAPPSAAPSRALSAESEALLAELQSAEKDVDAVARLLNDGADANCRDRNDSTALALAVKFGFIEAVDLLIDAGADVNATFAQVNQTALHEATNLRLNGKVVVERLLKAGAEVDSENSRGETPQTLAIKYGNFEIADLLAAYISEKLLHCGS